MASELHSRVAFTDAGRLGSAKLPEPATGEKKGCTHDSSAMPVDTREWCVCGASDSSHNPLAVAAGFRPERSGCTGDTGAATASSGLRAAGMWCASGDWGDAV